MSAAFYWVAGVSASVIFFLSLLMVSGRYKLSIFIYALIFLYFGLFISYVSCELSSGVEQTVLQGFDFVLASILASFLAGKNISRLGFVDSRVLILGFIFVVYYVLGIINNGFIVATIYLRMFLYPFLLYLIALEAGKLWGADRVYGFMSVMGFFIFALLLAEVFYTEGYYTVFNGDCYYALSGQDVYRVSDIIDVRMRRWFNSATFDHILVFKAGGVTFNYPSTSYLLTVSLICSIMVRRYFLALLCVFGVFLLGTKAGLAMCLWVFLLMLFLRFRYVPSGFVLSVLMIFYAVFTVAILYQQRSVHAYSLMATIIQFPTFFLGRGMGYGGSVSMDKVEWTFENDMVVGDTGIGIGLSMLGIMSVFLFGFYFGVVKSIMGELRKNFDVRLGYIMGYFLLVIANLVVQELAIGPYGLGLGLVLLGVYLGDRRRLSQGESVSIRRQA